MSAMKDLSGRVAVVTGCSRGIGVELAAALAREGVHLSISARSGDELEAVRQRIESLGVRAIATVGDITDPVHRGELIERTVAELGPIDILVNNAGIEDVRRFEQTSPESLARVIDVNLTAPMLLTREVIPHMLARRQGHVVNISSGAGKLGPPYMSSYAASKHGLVGFTQSLHCEYRGTGVGFSAVCPAFVTDVGMYSRWEEAGIRSNRIAGTCTPEQVVKATLRCIRTGKPEATINTPPVRPLIVLGNIAPRVVAPLFRTIGFTKTLRRTADMNESG
jgi:short-subunit dehydrogenase